MDSVVLAAAYLNWLYSALGNVLAFFYALIPSYGFAIAMLTIAVRVLLIPLTAKQVKSQRAMQQLQPELKKLQAKYKGDRQRLNEEMMKLYKENKANPLAGCLPLILQMPLFIVLYRLIIDLSKIPPRHIPGGSSLYQALVVSQGKLDSLGIDLAEKPQSVIGLLMVAAVVATGYFQQKQMTGRLPQGSINPQMAMVTKVFPVFFGLISLSVPTGVVVYFVVSNIWQIGQQAVAFRSRDKAAADEDIEASTDNSIGGPTGKPAGKSGGSNGGSGSPTKSGGSTPKGGGGKSPGSTGSSKGGSPKGGGPQNRGGSGSGGGSRSGSRPPSGRVTPKGGPSGRVTPKGGPSGGRPSGGGSSGGGKASAGQRGGKGGSGSASPPSTDGEPKRSLLSPLNRAAKAKRPPPTARPKGLPPTKGSSGGTSRKEP